MNKLILSQAGVYRLHQLANQARKITGVRYRLSNELAMLNLLRSCALSSHRVIQDYFAAFAAELDEEQLGVLSTLGIVRVTEAFAMEPRGNLRPQLPGCA